METVTIKVEGMMCGGCSGKVQRALSALEGVSEATASAKEDNAVVTYDPAVIDLDKIKSTIVETGYEVVD